MRLPFFHLRENPPKTLIRAFFQTKLHPRSQPYAKKQNFNVNQNEPLAKPVKIY